MSGELLAWTLAVATLLGGAGAAWFFWDKIRIRPSAAGRFRDKGRKLGLSEELLQLPPECLRIIIEKPSGWEYRLLEETLDHELTISKSSKLDLQYGRPVAAVRKLGRLEFFEWLDEKLEGIRRMMPLFEGLVNEALPRALGPPGVSGDPEEIVRVSQKIGQLYRGAIEWSLEFQTIEVEKAAHRLLNLMAEWSHSFLQGIEELQKRTWYELAKHDSLPPQERKGRVVQVTVSLRNTKIEELMAELREVEHAWGIAKATTPDRGKAG